MIPISYPNLLLPTGKEVILLDGQTIELPKSIVTFRRWKGLPISNTFGGKALVDFDGIPMFAELAITSLFKNSGWEARWIETYGAGATTPYHFSGWTDGKLNEQTVDTIQNKNVLTVLNQVFCFNGGTYSGCWDVVGWKNDQIIFAESKRTKKDRFRITQYNWLSAALKSGLNPDNFLIVEWGFEKSVF